MVLYKNNLFPSSFLAPLFCNPVLLFVFQVVIMEGINTTGKKLVATKVYEVPHWSPLPSSFAAGSVCALLSVLETRPFQESVYLLLNSLPIE